MICKRCNFNLEPKEFNKNASSKNGFSSYCSKCCRDVQKAFYLKNTQQNSTFKLLGYDTYKLKQRIECQFKPGMSWKNYGTWHIDHKKPISKFDEKTSINMINMLCNLQPLWKEENLRKSNKFEPVG